MHRYQLAASLVQCLKAVANTYHQTILESTFPDALFTSLVQLFVIKNPSEIVTKFTSLSSIVAHNRCAVGCNGLMAPTNRSP